MATYTVLKRGSAGDDVKKLQQALGITADGKYGPQTEKAVRDYQTKNGLKIDGMAGNETLGHLYSAPKATTAPTANATPTTPQATSFQYKDFEYTNPQDSELVKQAEAMLQQHMANAPGEYQSPWSAQLTDTLDKILNREKFSYDLNGDALYQQYKDQYTTQGRLASADVMGQASAMTGGYGNSYVQTVGNQAYQGYLQQLNDKVPELYQLALAQYNQEEQNLKDQYSMLTEQDRIDYGKHRDKVSDYYTNLEYLTGRADTAYDKELTERKLAFDLWQDKQSYDYTLHRDAITDANTAKDKAYETSMAMLSMGVTPSAQMLQEAGISSADASAIVKKVQANEAAAKATNPNNPTNPTGNNPNNNNKGYDNGSVSLDNIKAMQKALGVNADGKWGPATQKAAQAKWGTTSANEALKKWQGGGTQKFTGSSYSDAVAFLKNNGVGSTSASSIMTNSEWSARRNSYLNTKKGGAEVANYSSYKEYLADVVEYLIEQSKK